MIEFMSISLIYHIYIYQGNFLKYDWDLHIITKITILLNILFWIYMNFSHMELIIYVICMYVTHWCFFFVWSPLIFFCMQIEIYMIFLH